MRDAFRLCSLGRARNSIVSPDAPAPSSDEVFMNSLAQLFPDTHYLMQTRLLDEKRNSTTQRGRVVPRRVLPTNLHFAQRQMSLYNQNYLFIQEALSGFCVFRPPYPFPSSSLRFYSPFLFKFHLAE